MAGLPWSYSCEYLLRRERCDYLPGSWVLGLDMYLHSNTSTPLGT
jgi:hypothetical protein